MARMIDQFDLIYPTEPEVDTTHVVSMWYIPGGYDYSNARVLYQFFPNETLAKDFEKRWDKIPEMASVMTLAQYLESKRLVAEHTARLEETREQDESTAEFYRASDEVWEKDLLRMQLQHAEGY